jgi:hypothetical protein
MWTRIATLIAAACLVAGRAAAVEPPTNDDCLTCHEDQKAIATSTHGPLSCVDCHSALTTATEFPHATPLDKVKCASCHDDIGSKYHDSIHAWAKEKAGLVAAPACADCHGKHDVKAHTDTASRVYRTRIPETCGSCHAGIKETFDKGIHAAMLKKGDSRAPSCADCHTAHTIQRADSDKWRLSVTAECGSCHAKVVDSFRNTFHGKVTELGFTRVAACADCHGAHEILPASNPASMVSKARLVETCSRCHAGANERFVAYDPHPNPRDYNRGKVLWYANAFYWTLIPGCFGFFGLHSGLWFYRSRKQNKEPRHDAR